MSTYYEVRILGPCRQQEVPTVGCGEVNKAEMVAWCGEDWVTPSAMDTPLPPRAHHHFCHQVHDGYFWLEELIPIMANLIHRISQLRVNGNDPVAIAGKSNDLALAKGIKAKYKLEKRK